MLAPDFICISILWLKGKLNYNKCFNLLSTNSVGIGCYLYG